MSRTQPEQQLGGRINQGLFSGSGGQQPDTKYYSRTWERSPAAIPAQCVRPTARRGVPQGPIGLTETNERRQQQNLSRSSDTWIFYPLLNWPSRFSCQSNAFSCWRVCARVCETEVGKTPDPETFLSPFWVKDQTSRKLTSLETLYSC